MTAGDSDVVPCAAGLKMDQIEASHLDRMIDQLVIARRGKATETVRRCASPRQAGRNPPFAIVLALPCDDLALPRPLFVPNRPYEYTRTVEVAARPVEIGRTHRQI